MAVTIVQLLGTDNVGASRVTINQNFIQIQDELNLVLGFVDPSSNQIVLDDGAPVPTQTISLVGAWKSL